MARPWLNGASRNRFVGLRASHATRGGGWGKLDAPGMIFHLRRASEVSLGEFEVEDVSTLFPRTVGKFLVLNVLPIPKGKIKAPEYFTPPPGKDFEEERRALIEIVDRFLALLDNDPDTPTRNPVMGSFTRRDWSRLHGLHLDHHLRQFGA